MCINIKCGHIQIDIRTQTFGSHVYAIQKSSCVLLHFRTTTIVNVNATTVYAMRTVAFRDKDHSHCMNCLCLHDLFFKQIHTDEF